jgi:hypothetical protein
VLAASGATHRDRLWEPSFLATACPRGRRDPRDRADFAVTPLFGGGRLCVGLGDLAACRRFCLAADNDDVAVLFDELFADALDQGQVLGAAERTVFAAVGDDRFGLAQAKSYAYPTVY